MGKHDLRFGFDMVRHQLNHWQPELNNPRGGFTFSGGGDGAGGRNRVPNQFNGYAAFLLGLPTNAGKSLQYLTMTGREWQFGWYLRDRWQATQHLTLSLGLRYEYYPLMTRADRGLERYDPTTNLVLFGRRGGNPDNVGIDVSKTILRAASGLCYRLGAEHRDPQSGTASRTILCRSRGRCADPIPRPSRKLRGGQSFTPFASLEQGIPLFTGPDLTPARRRCRRRWTIAVPGAGDCIAGTSSPGTSSLSGNCPATS